MTNRIVNGFKSFVANWNARTPGAVAAANGPVIQATTLEDRVLYSATPLLDPELAGADLQSSADAVQSPHDLVDVLADDLSPLPPVQELSTADQAAAHPVQHELVFIDSRIEDIDQLVNAFLERESATHDIEIVYLDATQDGFAQVDAALAGDVKYDAIHFVTHGADGMVRLGGSWLDAQTIEQRLDQLQGWSDSLTDDADLVFYGCDFAADEAGQDVVDRLSEITGADVAASDDATGTATRGGDWLLEYRTGVIDVQMSFDESLAGWEHLLATYVVTNTNDSGAGSLRQAISDANLNFGADTISFNIGTGSVSIALSTALPTITGQVTIDGWTQGGWSSTPLIIIDGNGLTGDGLTFSFTADNSIVRGLVIRDFNGDGIQINSGASGISIVGNYIGAFGAGGTDLGATEQNTGNGIYVLGNANSIGGTGANDRNVIGGNQANGIYLSNSGANNNTVENNYIGVDKTGVALASNLGVGILIDGGANTNTIGSVGYGNVIAGNSSYGIQITGSTTATNSIYSNFIGTDSGQTTNLGNGAAGIYIASNATGTIIGSTTTGYGNVIAYNAGAGIGTDTTTAITATFRGNSIYANSGLGIDLSSDGVTLNDANDADAGPNGMKNFFLPTTVTYDGSQFTISGTYDGLAAARTYNVDLFANSASTDEAKRYLGTISFTTNTSGDATITNQTLAATLNAGEWVSFITTDMAIPVTSEIAAAQFSWQEGTASYASTQDTFISTTQSSTSYGTQTFTHTDNSDVTYGASQTLLRFDNLFGTGTNQIPLGSVILSARLVLYTTDAAGSTTISMHRMLANWSESSTYNSLTGGVSLDNTEALSAADVSFAAPTVVGSNTISGLEAAVQAWSNGAANYGWVFATNSTDSWQFASSENGTVANRPQLIVDYVAPTVGVVVTPTTGLTTTESGGTAQFSVVLTAAPTANVTIAVASSDTTEGTVSTSLLTFTTANWNVAQTVTVTGADDEWIDGNVSYTVTLGAMTSSDTRYSGLNPVDVTLTNNDNSEAPVHTVPGAQSTNEDTARVFSSGNGNQILLTDYDPTGTTQVTLTVTNGTLTLAGTTGLTFTSGDGTSDTSMTFYGSIANINNALNGLSFSPTADYNGGATLTLATRDSTVYNLDIDSGLVGRYTFDGNANDVGPGTAQNGTLVNGPTYVNDATRGQVLSLDGVNDFVSIASTYSNPTNVTIGGWVNLLSGTGRKEFISLDDRMHIALDDTGGVKGSIQTGASSWLDLNSNQFISGTGWHHVMFTFSDTDNVLRLYIDGVQVASTTTTSSIYWTGATTTYIGRHPTATTNFPNALVDDVRIYNRALTADEIESLANDLVLADADSVAITVNAVNDAPTATITPTTYAVNEQATLTLHGTGLSIADIDAASSSVRATLSVVSGTISVSAGSTGATISGSGTNTVTITGTITQVNNVLAGASSATVTYTLNSDAPPGSDTLTLTANDQGNTGSGGALTASDTATINITALNDAPTAVITPTTYAVNEQATLTLHGTGLSIADVDAASSTVRATLSVVSGTITATAGTTGVTISGSGTNTVTLTGTLTQINNLLAGNLSSTLTYTLNSDTPPGSDTLTFIANDQGNTGSGGSLTATDTAAINITALNDAPTATITPTSYAVNEQQTALLSGTGLSIADVDAASGTMSVTLSVGEGTLTVTAGSTGATVSNSGTSTVTITGTVTQINNLLAGNLSASVSYVNNTDTPSASTTLTLAVNDQGNSGSGGALTASDTAAINITALNDAPTAVITPTTYAVNEQATLTLHGTGLSIADVDAASSTVRATLSVVSGTISASAGTTGVTITGSGTNTLTLTGTLTQINNLLAGNLSATLTYTINSDTPPGSDTLTLTANDQGNTGSGGALTASDTATINITALNDAPVAAITPTSYSVNEQATLTLHGTGLSITDVDAASSTVQATLSVVSGTITATAGTTGVTVSGSGTNTVTLTGTLTQINNLLAGNLSATLTYTLNSDTPAASDTLTLIANDQGNTGSGGALTASDTAAINITALNDAPTATITPTAYGVNEQASVLLSGTGLSIADADAASGTMSVTLAVGEGTLTVAAGSTGATVTNSGTSTVTITGTVTQINNLLAGASGSSVSYIDNTDTPSASTTLTMTVNDQGNTGSGGALTASDTATINITAVNDAPTAVITPTTYAVNEQATLTLHGTGLSIADVDAASGTMSVTLSVGEGTLTVTAGTTGATVTNSGTSTVTITGTITQINNLLAGNLSSTVTYTDNTDTPSASTTLTMTVNDQGNTGSGGALTGNDSATINITALNDAPTATITPTTYSVNEQTTLTLHGTGLSIADVDAGSGTISVTLSVGEGTLTVTAGTSGATVTNSGTATVTITGTVTQINNVLAGNNAATVSYLNPLDTPAASTVLTLAVNDLGNTGSGGSLTSNDTATINITPINDAPTTSDVNASGAEDSASVAITLVGADVDGTVTQFQLSGLPANGTLYLDAGLTTMVSAGVNYAASGQQLTLYFAPQADWNGVTTFQYYAIDNLGLADASPNTATLTINAVNDAPVITSNGGGPTANVSIVENTTAITTVTASDIDLPAQTLTYSIVNTGDGALFAINGAGVLTFIAAPDYENPGDLGGDNVYDVTVQVSDGITTDTQVISVTVTNGNETPTATITPTSYSVNEQATLTLHGTGLSIADSDAGSGTVSVTLSVGEGTLNVTAGSSGVSISNSGTSNVTLTGTVAQINDLLAGNLSATVTYIDNTDTPSASTTLTLLVNDLGNTGAGGPLTASDTATINITALNDAPTATITPTSYSVNEQATLTLHGTGLSIADADGLSGTLSVTLSVGEGTLTVTAGTTGATVTNSGTSTVTITGTVGQINNLLAGSLSGTVTYTDNTDTPSASTTLTMAVNDQGNTGSGGALTANDTATINITALNDAPTATITPTSYSVNEQATLTLHSTGLSIADVDAASSTVQATLSVVSGTISAAAGTTGVTVSGSGTNTVTLTGTLAQINNLLAGNLSSTLTYTLNSDTPPGSDTLTLTANDQGNTGSGGALTASDTATINITALNDAPTATITPTSYSVNEQATLTLHGTGLSITDADAASSTMSVTLSVGEGTLTVTAGTTGATVTNSGTSTVTITGTVTQINNLLAGNLSGTVTYIDNTDTPSASTTLTMTVNDQGNTGSGGALTANDTATINITALNDAPTATITPTSYSVNEQTTLALHGTGLAIADVDASSGVMQVTLSVGTGTLNVAAGSTGTTVTGSGTSTVTVTGTVAQINNLLAGNNSGTVDYILNSDTPSASTTLTMTVNDQGNTGTGGSLTSTDTAAINITALNDAPTATITPTSYSVNEQATLTLHGTGLSIADADAVSGTMSVTLSVGEGTLTVTAGSTGATVSNSGTSTVTITGTVTQINNLLAGNLSGTVTYTDNTNTPSASTTLTMTVNDQGNTGSGGALTANDTATINITALNDAPTATITPTSYSVNEQATLTLHGTGLSITDADALSGTMSVTLSVGTGTLNVAAGSTGVSVSGSGTSTVTLTGTVTQINDLLAGNNAGTVDYVLNSDTPVASTTLTMTVNDQGNTGSGGALTANDTATINITALNDAPTATITPTSYSVNEQATLTLHGTGLSIADVDAASSTVRATLSVVSGTLSAAAGTTGVTVSGSGTNTVTLTGTLTQINNLLAGNLSSTLTYTLNSDTPPGSDTLTLTANDQGNTGSGGALTASDTATINITALNDAPTATITPTTYSVNEQATLTLHGTGLSITDADAASSTISVTLSVGEGTLTVTAGTTGATVTNSGTSSVTVTGTVTQINNLLAGNLSGTVTYIDNTDTPSASTTLTMTVNDQGNTGSGGALTANDTATINITALNDAPISTIVPNSYATNEQTTLVLHGTGLSIADADASSGTMQVTLSVTEGRVNISAGSTGATIAGSGTSTATITGTLTQINNVLAGNNGATVDYYNQKNNPAPSTTLTMTVNDQGNTGSGGALTASDTVLINIVAFNNAPTTNAVSASANEDVASRSITLMGSDVDGTVDFFQLTTLPTAGLLYLDAGLTISAATGVNYAATSEQLTLYFAPGANFNGVVTFDYFGTDDLGQVDPTGATGTITINAVNDAPTANNNSVSLASVNEDTASPPGATVSALFGSAYNDSADQVSGGSSANNLAGIAITANSAVSATQGNWQYYNGSSWVNISTAVSTTSALVLNASTQIRFLANADYNGTPGTLTVRLIDDSFGAVTSGTFVNVTTSGGTTRYSNVANAITLDTSITAINDAPTATITPTTYTVSEQVTLNLHGTGLAIADVDAASGTMSVTLSVGEGTLNVAAGATGTTVTNSGTSTVTLTGTVTQINNLLAGVSGATATYVNSTDTPSSSTVLTLSVNDQGNTGSGGALTASDTATINITALNDAPTAVITPTTYAVNEQTTLSLHGTGLTIADVDAGSAVMRVTLSVGTGTLTIAAGTTGVTVSGSGTATVTLNGTATQLNDLLAGNNGGTIDYFNSSDAPSASTTLTMTVNDLGNTGTGGALTATDTATINITALNDAPVATITPTSYTVNEQATLTLHGTGLTIADVDAASGTMSVTLSVGEGTLNVTAGSTGASVSGSGTGTVTVTGTVTQINNLLAGNLSGTVTYVDNTNTPSASTTLTLTVNDQGNTGSGGSLTSTDTATINITALNDAPTATITPTSYSVNEQVTLTLHGTGLSISDADAFSGTMTVTLSVGQGTLDVAAGSTGATIANSGTSNVTITGTVAQINDLLAGNLSGTVTYTNGSDAPNASTTLTLSVNDQGNTGSGGSLIATDTATINVTALNDAPTATITLNSYGVNEATTLTLHGTGLAIADVDAASGTMRVTLSVGEGTLNVAAGSTGATVTGSGTNTITVTGTVTQINNLLAGNNSATVTYINNVPVPAAATTLTMTVNDQGNTGSGGSLLDTDTATINIGSFNDAPTATITPTTYTVNEQATLTLHGTGLSLADIDANGASVEATLTVVSGTISASAGSTGVTISGSGTNTVTLNGTLTQINNLLAGNLSGTLTYTLNSDTPPGSDTLTLAVNDLGNTGSGGALIGSDSATINITALNDAPTAVITPTTYAVNEQTTLSLHGTGLTIADVDAGSAVMRVTLSVGSGALTVAAGTTGVTVSGSGTATVTLNGTATQLNDLLAGNNGGTIDYFNSSDAPSASTTLTMIVNDLGNTGTGGALTATDTATINITAFNDAPTATITPGSYTVNEQTNLTLHGTGLSIADVDAGGAVVVATLNVGEGTLTATAGSTGVTISGSGTSTVTFTGTIAQINNLLAGNLSATLRYIDNTDAPSASTTLTLTVNDQGNSGTGGALLASDTATININNVNDAPVILNNTFSLLENSANATLVGLVPVTDPDLGDTHTYSITAGNTSGAFSIDNTGALVVLNVGALDFELIPIFTLTVRVQDAAGAFDTATIIVNLLNVNESAVGPVSDTNAATNQVNENSLIGTTVGLTANATDGDTLDLITYSLDDSAGGLFAVNPLTGVVTVAGALNAETAQSHTIIVRATSSDTSYSTQSFTINVLDVNESPVGAVSDVDSATNEVAENSAIGTTVGVTAFADDTDVTATVSYSLTNSAGGRFAINAVTGVVTVAGAIDAETASSYTITVRATSSDGSNTSQSFVINVLDVNESPVGAISDTNASVNQVSEAAAIGATVGLTAFADDTDVTDTVSYSLDDDAGSLFTIDANTGVVTVAAGLDAETAQSHTIIVRATSSDTSSSTRTFTINILDVNEVSLGPLSDTDSAANQVAENAANGTVVGITALAVDGDVTATVTYTLTNSAGGRFAIDANTGVVTVAGSLDAETATSYTITVRATSSDSSISTQSFTINLLDVNEFPTTAISDTNVATNQVAENSAIGTTVGITAYASDGDVTDIIAYSLDDDAGGLFAIDANTGVVTVAGAIDAETATSLTIIVRATSTDTSFTVRSFTINILDVNEYATTPVTDADAAVNEVTENSVLGTVVGVTGLASDGDVTDTHSYSLDNDAGGLFTIDANTGVITVAGAIDYETAHSYTVIVRATSTDTSFATQSFTINVLDVNDNPPTLDLDGDNSSGASGLDYVTTFTEDAGPVLIGDFDLTINDPDSPIINSVVITITNRLDGAAELLAADTTGTSITAAFVNGVLTLSGADTLAHYQQVLQTVSYVNLSDNADLTNRVITFVASDGTLSGPTATATIHLVGTADAPTLTAPNLLSAIEDTPLTLSSATTGTAFLADVDSATLEMTISVLSGNITLATTAGLTFVTGDGIHDTTLTFTGTQAALNAALDGISFTPDADFNGLASISWTVRDPDNLSANGTTTIDVAAVNDAPVLTGITTVQTDEDTPVIFGTATGNAFQIVDIDAGTINVTLSTSHGALTLASVQGLTFVVGDGLADNTLTFMGSVSDVNTALDGLQFTPTADYHGGASLQIDVDDQGNTGTGGVLSDSLQTSLQINSVNDAPAGVNDRIETRNIDTIVITTANFLANDIDVDGDSLTATLLTRPTHGTLVESGSGTWLYVPDVTFFGDDTFTYITSDGQTTSQPITVTIAISIAGGPNGGGGASNAAAVSGIVSGALITSASKEESTSVVNNQATAVTVLPVSREVVNEAPVGPMQNNANPTLTVVEVRALDTDSQATANFRSGLVVRGETTSRSSDASIARLLSPMTTYTPFNVGTIHTMLDGLRDQVEMRWESMHVSTGSVAVTAVGLTAGYALWALRGAHLVATLLTTMPAWWSIDPLPILTATQAMKMRDDDHEETLADIAGGAKKGKLAKS